MEVPNGLEPFGASGVSDVSGWLASPTSRPRIGA